MLESDLSKALDHCEQDSLSFDIAFLDPPYQDDALYAQSLSAFGTRPLLNEGGVLVMEHSKRVTLAESAGTPYTGKLRLTHGKSSTQERSKHYFYRELRGCLSPCCTHFGIEHVSWLHTSELKS